MDAGRILIIASYNGPRHNTPVTPTEMLEIQYKQLEKLDNKLDNVVVVVNEADPDPHYDEVVKKFSYIRRENIQGSYGAWKEGFVRFPDYEWYFFLEDDYTFYLDNFDQRWIDLWKPGMSYLASKVGEDHGLKRHASISNGLTRGEILRQVDWSKLTAQYQYDMWLQIGWSDLFDPDGLADIKDHYAVPFFDGNRTAMHGDGSKPILIGPVQSTPMIDRELSLDRHRQRMADDPVYRATHAS